MSKWIVDIHGEIEGDFDLICKADEIEKENKALKNRCYAISKGSLCFFCPLKCEHRNCDFRYKESEKE